jgi:hypothetical protein
LLVSAVFQLDPPRPVPDLETGPLDLVALRFVGHGFRLCQARRRRLATATATGRAPCPVLVESRRYGDAMLRGRGYALSLVLLLGAGCTGGDPASSPSPSTTSAAAPATTGTSSSSRTVVPDVVLRDVATGGDVNLRALGLPERPTLYWFWAPH